MKVTKVPAEINAYTLSFSDKVLFIETMNAFAGAILCKDGIYVGNNRIEAEKTERIFKVLSDIGCRTSLGETYEDIINHRDKDPKPE